MITRRIQHLAMAIALAKYAYYVEGRSLISDQDFDEMEEELRRVCPFHSILTTVGHCEETFRSLHHDLYKTKRRKK